MISAAAANLAIPNIPSNPALPSPPPGAKIPTPVPVFLTSPELQQSGPPKFGSPFNNLVQQNQNNFQQQSQPHFGNNFNNLQQESQNKFPQAKFGAAFEAIPSIPQQNQNNFRQPIQPQQAEFSNLPNQNNNQPDLEVEFIVEEFGGSPLEKLKFESPLTKPVQRFGPNEVAHFTTEQPTNKPKQFPKQLNFPQRIEQSVQVDLPNFPPSNSFERQVAPSPSITNQALLQILRDNPDIAKS